MIALLRQPLRSLRDNFGLSRAPVIDNDTIVGLVGYSDMVLKGLKV